MRCYICKSEKVEYTVLSIEDVGDSYLCGNPKCIEADYLDLIETGIQPVFIKNPKKEVFKENTHYVLFFDGTCSGSISRIKNQWCFYPSSNKQFSNKDLSWIGDILTNLNRGEEVVCSH